MEREFNRNQRSYRPRRNDSRDDYQPKREERQERTTYGEKRVRREFNHNRDDNNRSERYSARSFSEKRERNDKPVRSGFQNRPSRFSNNHEEKEYDGNRYRNEENRTERKLVVKKDRRENDGKRPRVVRRQEGGERYDENRRNRTERTDQERPYRKEYSRSRRTISGEDKENLRQKHYSKKKILAHRLKNEDENSALRLNRFISMGGVCSRRDADELIVAGRVKVNGEIVQTVGQKVRRADKVEVDGVQIFPEKKVYLVLNKPKDYVTTVEDPLERKTVMSLVEGACKERIYPVGRLDRQTTGVLLFTNDGDLAKKLTHPKYDHKKIYHVFLDKPLTDQDFEAIAAGVDLEDGFIKPDEINFTSPDCTEVGIEIHSGKNRIVRRIFEHLGYQIIKLDRVYFAGITKKNIPRGKWRFLTSREVNMLKVY